jgi:hypothetical protein
VTKTSTNKLDDHLSFLPSVVGLLPLCLHCGVVSQTTGGKNISGTALLMRRVIGRLSLPSIVFIVLPFQGDYNRQDVHLPDDCSWHPCQTVIVPREEQKKKWWDLDDNRKKQVEVQIPLLSCISIRPLTNLPDRRWPLGRCRHYWRWLPRLR